ncbi:MAG: PTS transporter subunit EIIC [Planctomycetes bacterium]|nr:PTS transporter subunit EIIC [Planctomycetota bacterium]
MVFFSGWAWLANAGGDVLFGMFDTTLACLSLFVCIGITYFLSLHYKQSVLMPVIIAIACFLILNSERVDGAWVANFFEGPGLFAAMLVALFVTEFYRILIQKKIGHIKLPASVPEALSASFEALVPGAIITFVASLFNYLLKLAFAATLPELVARVFKPLVAAVDNVVGVSLATILQQVLWWFGIHDTAIGTVLEPIRNANYAVNASAYSAGTAVADLPHILTTPFWFVFCVIGGSGATLGLAFLLLRAKSKQLRTVGKLGIVPAFFNINEPLLFGMPIVLNPLFLFPFIGAQLANAIITYSCMAGGLVNKTFIEPGWNLFAPIGALLSTMDFRAVILVLVLIVLDTLIYWPFLRVYDKARSQRESEEMA